jgi:hypothetical protein
MSTSPKKFIRDRGCACTSVSVSGSAPSVGASTQFTATANLSNSTSQTVTSQASWQSSNTTVATVTSSGVVTGVSAGNADITATYQNIGGVAHLTIMRPTPVTYSVTGTVTDGTSHGILPNITMELADANGMTTSTTTNGSGSYAFASVVAGAYTITASAVSYQTTSQSITVSGNTQVNITLPRSPAPPPPGTTTTYTCNGAAVPAVVNCLNNQPPGPPSAMCKDGQFSCSTTRSGTCSSHGGVACYVCPGPLC